MPEAGTPGPEPAELLTIPLTPGGDGSRAEPFSASSFDGSLDPVFDGPRGSEPRPPTGPDPIDVDAPAIDPPVTVPEPASALAMLVLVGGLVFARKRRTLPRCDAPDLASR